MPEMVGLSPSPRHQRPPMAPPRERLRADVETGEQDASVRRMYGDRMRIRKTQAMPQPKWGWVLGTLLGIAMVLGLGVALGGGLVAVGIGLGWLSVALVALIWHDLGLIYQVWQSQK